MAIEEVILIDGIFFYRMLNCLIETLVLNILYYYYIL